MFFLVLLGYKCCYRRSAFCVSHLQKGVFAFSLEERNFVYEELFCVLWLNVLCPFYFLDSVFCGISLCAIEYFCLCSFSLYFSFVSAWSEQNTFFSTSLLREGFLVRTRKQVFATVVNVAWKLLFLLGAKIGWLLLCESTFAVCISKYIFGPIVCFSCSAGWDSEHSPAVFWAEPI